MSKRKYSDEEKGTILAYYDATGGRLRKTARDTGVPLGTLRAWLKNNACANNRTLKKRDLAVWLEDLAADLIDAAPDKIAKAGLKDIAVMTGVAIDKMRLLRGEPTSITATQERNRAWAEAEISRLMKEFDWSKEQATDYAKEHAPTLWALVQPQ